MQIQLQKEKLQERSASKSIKNFDEQTFTQDIDEDVLSDDQKRMFKLLKEQRTPIKDEIEKKREKSKIKLNYYMNQVENDNNIKKNANKLDKNKQNFKVNQVLSQGFCDFLEEKQEAEIQQIKQNIQKYVGNNIKLDYWK
ncbi:hypothetical protein PPERSA_01978 [Pseudocohnilembus persalinus]|uniref:Uncharacterized protein n=1 Tax=Pseudocohnilembus persalinus TaxID=266149 RepID=A0A0V0QF16_PSEPJ|nr:hypothetical protein PPERSA_01978 [Pseudocohnilembus persalinus]|eukprot:KRX00799.1 hypothetical protein PPERSA_01978 [Pseudocohnilembus persalinus]